MIQSDDNPPMALQFIHLFNKYLLHTMCQPLFIDNKKKKNIKIPESQNSHSTWWGRGWVGAKVQYKCYREK